MVGVRVLDVRYLGRRKALAQVDAAKFNDTGRRTTVTFKGHRTQGKVR